MPSLPKRKVGIVACSGEELPGGTVTRLAALRVLEQLRPDQTVTICLPLFLAGGEGDRAFAKFYPTIAIDGCSKRCAARATEKYSNKPAASIVLDEVLADSGLPQPKGVRRLSPAGSQAVDALANAISIEVDHLMAVRWSRSAGAILEPEPATSSVSTATCACGSGIPVTTVMVGEQAVHIMALAPIMELAYQQGLRASGPLPGTGIPAQILQTVQVYNTVPAGEEARYATAVELAWNAYCAERENQNNG